MKSLSKIPFMNGKKHMKDSLSFRSNFFWTFFGNVIYALSQWIIIVSIAKLGNVKMVGLFSLGLAITAPIVLFFNLQFRSIIATDTHSAFTFGEYFGARLFFQSLSMIIILFIITFGPYDMHTGLIILLVGISKVIESLSDLTYGIFQKNEQMDHEGKSQALKGFLSITVVVILLYLSETLFISLIGLILVWFLRFIYYDLKIVKKYTEIRPVFNWTIKRLWWLALPLGIVSLLNSFNINIPRYLLEYFNGLEDLGYFAAISYILVAGNLVIRPLSMVAAPKLAREYNNKDVKAFLKMNVMLFVIATIIGIIAISTVYFFGDLLLEIVYDSNYKRYNHIFLILIIGSVISYYTNFLNISLVAARSFKAQPILNLITSISGIISGLLLIPKYGLEGAAFTVNILYLFQLMGSLFLFLISIQRLKKGI